MKHGDGSIMEMLFFGSDSEAGQSGFEDWRK